MKSLFGKKWRVDALDKAEHIIQSFSPAEKAFFAAFGFIFIASVFWILVLLSDHFTVLVPTHGGSLTEGIIGTPRFVNPILATSDADRDIVALTYSGLMRAMPNGTLTPDLAKTYTISPDGLTYTFTLRQNAKFQDGTPVTADDVVFTVMKVQDLDIKSPEFANWNGVTAKADSSSEVSFTLKQPYAFFLQNATLGILPKHIWANVTDDSFPFSSYNTKPIGSGPFTVTSVSRDSSGVPTEYSLSAFGDFALGAPYLDSLTIKFYS
ncbi:MAG TPA: ABC transporter substrate-binding protein, partial [Candidatus Paceibacterota bacterium]|nr:ABC transporter substrate-binding protein [Candidatus Paceibacterota bacterium]